MAKTLAMGCNCEDLESSPFPIPQSRKDGNNDEGQDADNAHDAGAFQNKSRFGTVAQATSQSGQHGKTEICVLSFMILLTAD